MSKRNRVVILLILAGSCFIATANAELVITEIMSQSAHNSPTDCDWWELTNTGDSYVDLTGYSWDDDHQRPGRNVFASITISPSESIIIRDTVTAPGDPWKDDWGLGGEVNVYDPGYFSGGFSGLGSSDGVFLYDTDDVPVTSATYPSRTAGFSNEWAENGTSLGLSVVGENGAYASVNASPDVASPGHTVRSQPCSSSGRMIYWTDKDTAKIQRMNLDSRCVEDILTSADGLLNPRGLAIDLPAEKMYWADSTTGVIHRSALDGSGDVQLVTGLSVPADIALDTGSGKIYFAETGSSRIRRVNLDGSGPIEDVVTGLGQPYYIELDLTNSRIYWSDAENSVIYRANLDGTGGEVFITGLNHVRDIALDLSAGKIYWGDRGSSKIQRANLDAPGAVEDLFGPADGLDRPHGLLLDPNENKIYWTDTVTSAVHRGNTDGSGSLEDLATGLNGPWALAIVMVQEVKYVDADAAGDNDGSSWEDAFNCLQDALSAASLGDEIRVAQGVYRPDEDTDNPAGTGDREATFKPKLGVSVKGGYAGCGEPEPDERDIETYETILSGDLDGNDIEVADPCDLLTEPTRSENSYHVVTGSGIDETAVLDGFTITAGNANGSPDYERDRGGGMFNDGHNYQTNPTVIGCTFIGNSAGEFGGGMFNYGHGDGESNPILNNCTFLHNAARYEGGGMCGWASQAVVISCTFTGNFVGSGGSGGGMGNMGSSPVLRDCTFSDNVAGYAGGGMSNWEYSTPSLTNCIFRANSAGSGGGMHNGSVSDATLTNCTFTGNIAAGNGGAIQNYYGSSPTLTNCLFSGNSADSEGGVMYNDRNSDAILINCTLSGNSAQYNGGGICSHLGASPTLTNCILWGNDDRGGADESAQIHGGVIAVSNSCIQGLDTFTGNQNIGDDPLFRDADGPDDVVGTSDDNLRLMEASHSIDAGDNTAVPPSVLTDLDDNPRIINGTVDMGVYEFSMYELMVTVVGEHGTVEPSSGSYFPGTVVTLTATPEASYYVVRQWTGTDDDTSCVLTNTVTMDSDKTVTVEFGMRHVIVFPGEYLTIQGAIDAIACGDVVVLNAGLYSEDINFHGKNIIVSSMNPDDPTLVEYTVIQGTGAGPVVTFSGGESQSCMLDGVTITGGNTTGDGGGICGNGTEATIANCVIRDNHADGAGGGVSDCNGTIVRCTITGNTAGSGGGGICVVDSNVSVEDCDINYNAAAYGGGLYCVDSPGATITRCTITDNDANGSEAAIGGGILVFDRPILIEDCRISRNNAINSGGGIYFGGSDQDPFNNTLLRNCLVTLNRAGRDGGGISVNWYAEPVISNCTIADNQVTGSAGVGYGGGLYCSNDSHVEVINSIIWGNCAEQGFQVAVTGGDSPYYPVPSTLALSYSDVEGGPGGAYVEVDTGSMLDWGIGAIDSDPQLVDPTGGDWRLGVGSPCIDNGDNAAIPLEAETDLAGHPRIIDGDCNDTEVVDMGAYEFAWAYIGDFDDQCDVDFADFAIFALAWLTEPGDGQWNPTCDIGTPKDSAINMLDLQVFAENWLAGVFQ